MTDPVPVERFWRLTSTAWTAIGSIVSALSVIALVAFNWRYLHWAHKQSDASVQQAAIARDTLKQLQSQIVSNVEEQRHQAHAVLRDAIHRAHVTFINFHTDVRSEQSPIQLIPDDWNLLVAYVTRHLPHASKAVAQATQALHIIQGNLNKILVVPANQRGPNSSWGAAFTSAATNLAELRKLLDEINKAFPA